MWPAAAILDSADAEHSHHAESCVKRCSSSLFSSCAPWPLGKPYTDEEELLLMGFSKAESGTRLPGFVYKVWLEHSHTRFVFPLSMSAAVLRWQTRCWVVKRESKPGPLGLTYLFWPSMKKFINPFYLDQDFLTLALLNFGPDNYLL